MISFTVFGTPVAQGSARGFIVKGKGGAPDRAIVTNFSSSNQRLKPWRQEVAGTARAAMNGHEMFGRGVPVNVEASFHFDKPKSVKGYWKTTKPDMDKLLRALLDSLTGIVFHDDAQVVRSSQEKVYDLPARVEVRVSAL